MFELEEMTPRTASFEMEESYRPSAIIKVIGVGGAGGNAVNRMVEAGVQGVEFISMNTDMQALAKNLAPTKLQLGAKLTGGKGVGADPEKGRQSAMESEEQILDLLRGADMVFVAAGMGKGTGTGAAPVVAELSRGLGILTIPVVTRPFEFEGVLCRAKAEKGLATLRGVTEALLVISADRVLRSLPLPEAYRQVDDTLRHAIQSISAVVTSEGLVNCDFNDVRAIMGEKGGIYMGVGAADGDDAPARAASMALNNPFLDGQLPATAQGLLVMISVKDEMRFSAGDLGTVLSAVNQFASRNVNLIHSEVFNPSQEEDLRVTVIATGLPTAGRPYAGIQGRAQGMEVPPVTLKASGPQTNSYVAPTSADLNVPAFMRRRQEEFLADSFLRT